MRTMFHRVLERALPLIGGLILGAALLWLLPWLLELLGGDGPGRPGVEIVLWS